MGGLGGFSYDPLLRWGGAGEARDNECLEVPNLANWMMLEETGIPALSSTLTSRPHTYAAPTPTQISGTLAADASLVATVLLQQ